MPTAAVPFARLRMRRAGMGRGRSGVAGQALVLFVVLVGVLCLGLILLFNTGQAVDKKVRLTHAADAAAYSVAVQQARVMNYAAYMNRGRIANEVAIAQMVSLWSWLNMIHTHTIVGYNLFTGLSVTPVIGAIFQALARVYQAAERVIGYGRDVANPALNLTVKTLDEINGFFAASTRAMLDIGGTAAGIMIAHDVIGRNDPNARMSPLATGVLAAQLLQASRRNTGNSRWLDAFDKPRAGRSAGMDRYRNVVMASRDHFSADRSDDTGLWPIDLESKGGTDLVDYDRWVGMDTLDLSVDLFMILEIDVPLGWGGAQAVRQERNQAFFRGIRSGGRSEPRNRDGWYSDYHPGNRNYSQYGGVRNRGSGSTAGRYPSVNAPLPLRPSGRYNSRRDAYITGYEGLRDYDDIRLDNRDGWKARQPEGDDAGPRFSVFVESERRHARTSEDVDGLGGRNGGQFELRSEMADDKMTAISSAQVYFNRAPDNPLFRRMVPRNWQGDMRHDTQLEAGSLFSPYWQARLVETPASVYAAVGAATVVGI